MSAMEQLSSMFTRLKRGVGAGGDSSQPSEKQQMSADISNNTVSASVVEEDGFLIIDGEHESHTGVYAATFESNAIQAQATFCDQVSGQHVDRKERGFTMFATCNPMPVGPVASADAQSEAHSISSHPDISDVPFQMNPRLQEKDQLQEALAQLDLETTKFDWQKYYYDFDFEHSSLRELCAMGNNSMQPEYPSSVWER